MSNSSNCSDPQNHKHMLSLDHEVFKKIDDDDDALPDDTWTNEPLSASSHSFIPRCLTNTKLNKEIEAQHSVAGTKAKHTLPQYNAKKCDDADVGEREEEKKQKKSPGEPRRMRDLVAYWVLGFCNNFTYWVMITAAYDLIAVQEQIFDKRSALSTTLTLNISQQAQNSNYLWKNDSINNFKCHHHSTGTILVADTLPATTLTLAAPLTMLLNVHLRVGLVSALCVSSYLVLGLAQPAHVFLGVALASASRGFSDGTFLGQASRYHKHVLSLWSSGTGVATFVGPLLYSAMTTLGLHPRLALLSFIAVPLLIVVSFWCLLSRPRPSGALNTKARFDSAILVCNEETEKKRQNFSATIKKKLNLFLRAQKTLLPLFVFYLLMYITNQGLLQSVYFPASHMTHAQQYSWINTVRCLGTLISRSSHKVFILPSTWIYSLFAVIIMVLVGTEAYFHYLPSEYIIFTLLLVQGLVEGAAFRATIFNIYEKASEEEREFCLGIFPASLFCPALLAGFVSIPTHNFLCLNQYYRE